jgi:hypothetical protein
MALTRPLLSQLNTNIIAFSDNMMVMNAANVANRDIGTVYDRSQGSVSNVAMVWQESRNAFTFAYTSSSGLTNANLTLTSNANIVAGNVFSGTSTVTGNITGGNVNTAGVVRATGDVFGKEIWSTQSSGDEGGQLNLSIAATNTTLNGNIVVDVFQNRLRFFEGGGTARGAYIDLTQAGAGVSTNLLAGGGGGTPGGANTYVQFNDGGLFGGNVNFTYDKGLNIVSAGAFAGTTNGTGQNFKVGDDAWIGDINLANTIGIRGQQDATQGYIVFGNSNGQSLGRSSAGALTYQGAFTAQGGLQNTPIGNATPSTALFTTVGSSGNTTVSALTVNATATIGTTLGVSGNVNGTSITLTGSLVARGPGDFDGGLQSTPIGNAAPSTALFTTIGVSGNTTVSALTVNATATIGGALSSGAHTITGSPVTAIINGGTTGTGNIGATGATFNTVFAKATTAQYADLAEIYIADDNYPPGTVVVFGGSKEITVTSTAHDTRVAGVISTNPAYLMNSEVQGLPVALTGRVPCLVQGPINKGEVLVTGLKPGTAQRINPARFHPGCVIGKSLENIPDDELKLIEIVVGRF